MPRPDFRRAAVVGVLAGLAAGAAMNAAQAASSQGGASDDEPATTKAADRLWRVATGVPLPDAWRDAADPVVHYATSAILGLGYAVAAETWAPITRGGGSVFGFATAVLLDEGAVSALGLGPSPLDTPLATHAYAIASHLVFGFTLEAGRRLLRG